ENAVGNPGSNGVLFSLQTFNDGSGTALYAGGFFTSVGGVSAKAIAKWDGAQWSSLAGPTLSWPRPASPVADCARVLAMTVLDDGNGSSLYVGGGIGKAGALTLNHVGKWDGQQWSSLGGGVNGN